MKKWLIKNRKTVKIIGITIIILTLPITLILVKQTQDQRSSAAAPDKLEVEAGVLASSGVSKQSDSQASGGQYVLFNQSSGPSPTNSPQPTSPPTSNKYPPSQTGVTYIAVPNLSLPGYLQSVKDPSFPGTITRISNTDGWRNHYPKDTPWNADGSLAAFYGYGDRLIDGNTYQDLGSVSSAPGRPVWSNVDPDIIWGTHNNDNRLKKYSVSKKSTTYRTFSEYTEVNSGSSEGNLSNDDRYIGLLGRLSNGSYELVHFDITDDKILYKTPLSINPDWFGVSQSGRYLVAAYADDGTGSTQGYKIYDRLSSNPSQPRHLANKTSHSDFAKMEDGTEVLVHIDGSIKAVRLSDGQSWNVLSGSSFGHISGRAINRPGWVYVSGNVYSGLGNPGHDQLAAVKIDGSQTVQVFAHARTIQPRDEYIYDESTHAAPNRDGTKIIWGGRWNDTGGMYSYVVEVK